MEEFINIGTNKIHPSATLSPHVDIGENNIIMAGARIGGEPSIRGKREYEGVTKIGNGNVIGENTVIKRSAIIGNGNLIMGLTNIGHDVEIGDLNEIGASVVICGFVKIRDQVKIKTGVLIRNRISIVSECTIGMGSNVISSINETGTYYGNPARKV